MPIPFTALVNKLPATIPFVGPETLERNNGRCFKARIGANESSFGLSPLAVEAMRDALPGCAWYGDPENYDLRAALAEKHGVAMDNICVDAGIDSLLSLTVRMLTNPGDSIVTSLGAYPTFNYHVNGYGGQLVTVPYKNDRENPRALLAAVQQHRAPLVYLANPDNPMGTWNDAETISAFINALPETTVLALDEAYIEFADANIAPELDTTDPRVIRLRTFSKAYGMAGLRIGYVIAHQDLITGYNKIRNHFAVNRIAQIGALASLSDASFLPTVAQAVTSGRQRIHDFAARYDLPSLPSQTNFVAVDLGSTERASTMLNRLAEQDVFIRMPGVAPLNRCIRVGVGQAEEQDLFEQAFTSVYDSLQLQS